jgi:hypothetical protein
VSLPGATLKGETVYDEKRAYSEKFRDYFRLDIRLAFRMDNKKFSQEFAIDVQNITSMSNPLYMQYNPKQGRRNL